MLFDGFATQSEVQRQIARIDSASRRVQETAEFIALDAVEAHLDMLRNQALVELARENIEQHQRMLGQVRQLKGQGGGSIADVHQAEARLAEAQNALAVAFGNLHDAEALYLAVVGMPAQRSGGGRGPGRGGAREPGRLGGGGVGEQPDGADRRR